MDLQTVNFLARIPGLAVHTPRQPATFPKTMRQHRFRYRFHALASAALLAAGAFFHGAANAQATAALTDSADFSLARDTPALKDTRWTLSSLYGIAAPAGRQVTMGFDGDRVQGTDGCNRYAGTYTSAGETLRIGERIASTNMACPQAVMEQAQDFVRALVATRAFRAVDRQLVLLDADGNAVATLTAQRQELAGTAWRVTGYNNGRQAVVSVLAGSDVTLEFSTDGRLGGSAGCNNYNAAYTSSGKSIAIRQAATTRKLCSRPYGVMEQEAQLLNALHRAAIWSIDGDRLELRTAEGALALTLSASAPEYDIKSFSSGR